MSVLLQISRRAVWGPNLTAFERYPRKWGTRSSHQLVLSIVGRCEGKRALDIGCARGHLLDELSSRGWSCIGIDSDPSDVAICRSKGLSVLEMNLAAEVPLNLGCFDLVILADVLEHFAEPERLLESLHKILNPGATIVVSVPNIAHISVRLQLLIGRFRYTSRGILDRTHVRFFTKQSIMECLIASGFGIRQSLSSAVPLELVWPAIAKFRIGRLFSQFNDLLPILWRGGFTYQFIVEAQPRTDLGDPPI